MHSRDLVELAAVVAVHAPMFVRGVTGAPPAGFAQEYWSASRCRLDRWTRLLKRLADASTHCERPAHLAWVRIAPVLHEILASEMLTRIWSATAKAYDRAGDDLQLDPAARAVRTAHQEARQRLLALLADGRTFSDDEAAELNHLRERVERWSDMLLSHLARDIDITEFAFDPARAVEFAADLEYPVTDADRHLTAHLILGSLKASFETCLSDHTPNSDLNRRLGAAIVACFHGELFQPAGPAAPHWLHRIDETASDAQGLINELVGIDADHPASSQSLN